jgi:cell wall assembly regulator SMI1
VAAVPRAGTHRRMHDDEVVAHYARTDGDSPATSVHPTNPDQMLTDDLLEQLASRWRDHGVPVATRLSPGLPDEQIDALTSPLGITLPTEARRWWRWHDGVAADTTRLARDRELAPGLEFLPLNEAVQWCERYREVSRSWSAAAPDTAPDPWWAPSWFPLTHAGQAGIIACDSAVPAGAPTPIRRVWPPEPGNAVAEPLLGSLADLVRGWIDAFDLGAWRYGDGWKIDPDRRAPIDRLLFG